MSPLTDDAGTPLDPRMVWVWTVLASIPALLVLGAVSLLDFVVASEEFDVPGPRGLLTLLTAAAAAFIGTAYPRAAYRHWRYILGDRELELWHGVFFRRHAVLPYYRVQHIDVTQGPIDRMMKLSRLVIHTASAGTDKEIPGVASDVADALRRTILSRTGAGDAV